MYQILYFVDNKPFYRSTSSHEVMINHVKTCKTYCIPVKVWLYNQRVF